MLPSVKETNDHCLYIHEDNAERNCEQLILCILNDANLQLCKQIYVEVTVLVTEFTLILLYLSQSIMGNIFPSKSNLRQKQDA